MPVDDRTREWKGVTADVIDNGGESDYFAKESLLSQRSAFARQTNGANSWDVAVAAQWRGVMGKGEEEGGDRTADVRIFGHRRTKPHATSSGNTPFIARDTMDYRFSIW